MYKDSGDLRNKRIGKLVEDLIIDLEILIDVAISEKVDKTIIFRFLDGFIEKTNQGIECSLRQIRRYGKKMKWENLETSKELLRNLNKVQADILDLKERLDAIPKEHFQEYLRIMVGENGNNTKR